MPIAHSWPLDTALTAFISVSESLLDFMKRMTVVLSWRQGLMMHMCAHLGQ